MPIVVAVLAAWSCSSRDELQSEQERVPIRLATSLDGTGARTTRAGTTNNVTQSTEFLAGQYVDAYIKVKGGDWLTGLSATTPRHFQVNTTDTNSDGIVDGDLDRKSGEAMDYYPMDATPVTIYAVHPSVASAAAFTVSNDQTDADNYAASDLCYSKTADYNRTEAKQTLRFKHVLSKIVVNVDVSELGTPTVSNLRLKAKTKTSITYPYPSDATNDYQIGSASEVDYIKMNVGGAAIIPPQKTSAVGDVLITFDVAGVGPIAYKFPANTTFASNTQYIYTVKVGGTISVTSTITDWDAGTYSPGDELLFSRPTMPIEYLVGTTNMAATSDDVSGNVYIATTHKMARGNTPQETAYFRHSTAVDKFSHVSVVEPNGVSVGNYHLARTKEWMSILPPYWITNNLGGTLTISGSNGDRIEFGTNVQNTNKQESAAWGAVWNGSSYTYQVDNVFKNDYFCPSGTTIGYGLRFKDNTTGSNCRYTCAFRYEYKATDASVGGGASLTIQSIYVGRNPNITITTISDEAWWSSSTDVITIVFPATGIAWPAENNYDYPSGTYSSSVINDKSWGWFRSRDEESSTQGYTVIFQDTRVYGNNTSRKAYSIPVRLFRDAE